MLALINHNSAMHDNDTMAGVRVPSLHHTDIHRPLIKRPFEPLSKPVDNFDENYNQEIDDDDFSDHDSHYSEDFMDDACDFPPDDDKEPSVTQKLLSFAEMVNCDIQRFFGKKKDDDSCDIYEDKWKTTKSGRELYYADLLRIAQGENVDSRHTKELLSQGSYPDLVDNKHKFSGKMDTKIGLGPLGELFEYGLRDFLQDKKSKTKKNKKFKFDSKKFTDIMPMNQRKLPESFWREPGSKTSEQRVNGSGPLLQSSHPPDFSDLLQSWTRGVDDEFSGELSSSEMSATSSGSPMEQI